MHVDALGRTILLPRVPLRIVSLVPCLTEFMFAIGAGDRLVGVSDYCTEPADQLGEITRVGGTQNPDLALIAELRPDLVLAARTENSSVSIAGIEQAGFPVYMTSVRTVGESLEQLTALARVIGLGAGAEAALGDARRAIWRTYGLPEDHVRPRVVAFTWRDPWMAVGGDTYADDLLSLCGAENLGARLAGRNPRADLEVFMRGNPEVILLLERPYVFTEEDLEVFWRFRDVAAVRYQQIYVCDGRLLNWYGPRSAEAIQVLLDLFGQL